MTKKKKQEDNFERFFQEAFAEAIKDLPPDLKKEVEQSDIKDSNDFLFQMIAQGIDPVKILEDAFGEIESDDSQVKDKLLSGEYAIDQDSDIYPLYQLLMGQHEDEDPDDDEYDDDWDYFQMPKGLLLDAPSEEYLIRIKLNNAPVDIWRELVVPSNMSLELLAKVLQEAMGWEGAHLHQFIKGNTYYVSSEELKRGKEYMGSFSFNTKSLDADKFPVSHLFRKKGERVKFEYDFGDSWIHEVWMKRSRPYGEGEQPMVKLLKGQGACPPEDCGGIWGYEDLLEIRKKKRKTKEERERLEWYFMDKDFDPECFDFERYDDAVVSLWEEVKEEMARRKGTTDDKPKK